MSLDLILLEYICSLKLVQPGISCLSITSACVSDSRCWEFLILTLDLYMWLPEPIGGIDSGDRGQGWGRY